MPLNDFPSAPHLLLGSVMGILLSAGAVGAESPFSSFGTPYPQTLYLAQLDDEDDFDDDDEDFEDDDFDDDDFDDEDDFDDDDFDDEDDFDDDDFDDDLDDDIEDEVEDAIEDELEERLDDEAEDLAEEAAEDRLDEDDWEDELEDMEDWEDELEDIDDDLDEFEDMDDLDDDLDELEDMEDDLDELEDREDDLGELEDMDDDLNEIEDESGQDGLDDRLDQDEHLADALEERLLDTLEDDLENLIELNTGDIIVSNQMLVVTDDALLDRLNRHPGIELQARRSLSSLGVSLGSFEVQGDVPLEALRAELRETYPGLSVDFNHGYELNQASQEANEASATLSSLYRTARPGRASVAIGMLDGPVNATHPAFAGARLVQKSFVSRPSEQDRAHGTAIASLLVGRTPEWEGLVPDAQLYAASVFSEQAQYGSIATTQSLITALDWLVSQPVDIINISLAGPANQTLETVLQRVRDLGILPVAAAGNAGPLADPQYPAAYVTVVAVTAIDRQGGLYPYAVRGDHLDFAAYGVNLSAASGDQGFDLVTGTSFAAPVVSALLARYLADTGSLDEALQALTEDTVDLGEPGKDPKFGHGLPGKSQLQSPTEP